MAMEYMPIDPPEEEMTTEEREERYAQMHEDEWEDVE